MFITIRLFLDDIKTIFNDKPNLLIGHLGGRSTKKAAKTRVVMQVLVSTSVLFFSFFIILSQTQPDSTKKWAAGFIGTILGYWLR